MSVKPRVATQIPEPPLARFLFADTRMAWFWLIVRLYAGYEWFTAGWEKLIGQNLAFGKGFGTTTPGSAWVFNSHILAWRIAGYYGADRYLLPLLSTPRTGSLAGKSTINTPKKPFSGTPVAA